MQFIKRSTLFDVKESFSLDVKRLRDGEDHPHLPLPYLILFLKQTGGRVLATMLSCVIFMHDIQGKCDWLLCDRVCKSRVLIGLAEFAIKV